MGLIGAELLKPSAQKARRFGKVTGARRGKVRVRLSQGLFYSTCEAEVMHRGKLELRVTRLSCIVHCRSGVATGGSQ
jgi:hypothetical protein